MVGAGCQICGAKGSKVVYAGPVRGGAPGNLWPDATVTECCDCAVQWLNEQACLPDEAYESDAYRNHLGQSADVAAYHRKHAGMLEPLIPNVMAFSPRGKVVADIGCGGASLLDLLDGVAAKCIAIEPNPAFKESLSERGFASFSYASDAANDFANGVDLAISIQVIEHVADPVGFLRDAGRLLRKDSGRLFITTPNRRDFLMKALPDIYPAFFYRRAHRWYFDNASLARCAAKAGLKVEVTGALQRYGLSNTLLWMRDGRPSGGAVLPGIDEGADSYWKTYLEQSGTAEMLFMTFRP